MRGIIVIKKCELYESLSRKSIGCIAVGVELLKQIDESSSQMAASQMVVALLLHADLGLHQMKHDVVDVTK